MYLIDMIFHCATADPHRPAVMQPDMVTSYQALAEAIVAIGDRIDRLGFERAEPIAVSLGNPSYFLATVLAALRSGHNVALVNQARLPFLVGAGIRNLIYDAQGLMLSGGRNIRFDPSWLPQLKSAKRTTYRRRAPENADMIFFTSGTSGLPKKVIQSAEALQNLLRYPHPCATGPHQRVLVMPGLSSTFAFNRACELLTFGKTACFAPDTLTSLALIGLFRAEVVVASVAQALDLVKLREKYPGYRVDSIATLYIGGAGVSPETLARIRNNLCRNVVNHYGSTEVGVMTLTPFDAVDDEPGGIPLPWVDIEVVDEAGHPLPAGAEGLVRCRTPQLMENLERQDDLGNVSNGWFYPGDIGSMTADGVLRIHGRSSDVINRGGVKVSGSRIEDILQEHPDVEEAAACGIAGPSGMEELWIALVAKGPVDIDDIKLQLREHRDIRMAPDQVFILDELPRGDLGKVQKSVLKELLLSRHRG